MTNLIFSKKGFTLVGNLIALTVLGISGAGLMHYTSNITKTISNTAQKVEYGPFIRTSIINNMKSLLIEKNINNNGKKSDSYIYGICSLVEPPKSSHGIEEIKLSLSNIEQNPNWGISRWQVFFPKSEWTFVNESECKKIDNSFRSNGLNKCIRYKGTEFEGNIYVTAQIMPKSFPAFAPVTENEDSKRVVFLLKVNLINYHEEASDLSYISTMSDIVWAADVGECHINTEENERTIVKFSGTGPGSSLNKGVYNNPSFNSEDMCSKLNIGPLNADVIQAGQIDDVLLATLTAVNTKISCTRNKFRCSNIITSDTKDYDDIQFVFNVHNIKNTTLPIKEIDFTLKKGDTELDGSNDKQLSPSNPSFVHSSNLLKPIKGNTLLTGGDVFNIPKGSGTFKATVKNTSSYCHTICQNYQPGTISSYVYPVINIHADKASCVYTKDYSDDVSNRMRCTVCHTKACHRYGLGTFGPYKSETISITGQNQPNSQTILYGLGKEPLDGQIPECAAAHEYSSSRNLASAAINTSSFTSNKCKGIAMQVSSVNSLKAFSENTYKALNCNTKLPVLCFINGHYLPAMKINTSNLSAPPGLVKTSFHDAQSACFEMGQEIGNYYDLGILMFNSYRTDGEDSGTKAIDTVTALPSLNGSSITDFDLREERPKNEPKFHFINNTFRGMFLAPPPNYTVSFLSEKIKNTIKALIANNPSQMVWVAMEYDAMGAVTVTPPYALVAKDQPFSLFPRKDNNKPALLEDTSMEDEDTSEDTSTESSVKSSYFALTHNIRWKGLMPKPKTPEDQLHFVCKHKNKQGFFISKGQGEEDQGYSTCKKEYGIYLPPESSMDYVKLMIELNPNDAEYPFPNPELQNSDMVPPSSLEDQSTTNPSNLATITNPDIPSTSSSYLFRKNVPIVRQAWVALRHTTPIDSLSPPKVKNLRLNMGFRPEPGDETVFDDKHLSKSEIVKAIPNGDTGEYLSVRGVIKTLPTTLTKFTPLVDLRNYYQLCVKNYLPHSFQPLNKNCPPETNTVDLIKSQSNFKPESLRYMSLYISTLESNYYSRNVVLKNINGFKTKVLNINTAINKLINPPKEKKKSLPSTS